MNIDRILSNVKDYHLPICVLVFVMGWLLQWFGKMDSTFVAFTGTVLGCLVGHAFSSAWKGDDQDSQQK